MSQENDRNKITSLSHLLRAAWPSASIKTRVSEFRRIQDHSTTCWENLSARQGFEARYWLKDLDRTWRTREWFRIKHYFIPAEQWYTPLPDTVKKAIVENGFVVDLDHFLHLSDNPDEQFIAFTPSAAYGRSDRQVRMALGKYLKKYNKDRADHEIAAIVDVMRKALTARTLKWATTREEIAAVYKNGPSSCMDGNHTFATEGIHPSEVYASPDLKLAYMTDGERCTARCLCHARDGWYLRNYGDALLVSLLSKAGYTTQRKHLKGARLLRLECGTGKPGDTKFVMPYLDWRDSDIQGLKPTEDGKYFEVVSSDSDESVFTAYDTSGAFFWDGDSNSTGVSPSNYDFRDRSQETTCPNCDREVDSVDDLIDVDDDQYCRRCVGDDHTLCRDSSRNGTWTTCWVHDDAVTIARDDQAYSPYARNTYLIELDETLYGANEYALEESVVYTDDTNQWILITDSVRDVDGNDYHEDSENTFMLGNKHYGTCMNLQELLTDVIDTTTVTEREAMSVPEAILTNLEIAGLWHALTVPDEVEGEEEEEHVHA